MIIFNKKDSVYFEITSEITSGNFIIYPIDLYGNRDLETTISGTVSSKSVGGEVTDAQPKYFFEVPSIPDGRYEVVLSSDNFPDEVVRFVVFYNFLPEIIKDFKFLFCHEHCQDCGNSDLEKEYLKIFFKFFFYTSSTGLLQNLPVLDYMSRKIQKCLSKELTVKRYYGDFNFSYKNELHKFFVYFYAELYSYQKNKLKDLNEDSTLIDEVFSFTELDRCLCSTNLNLEQAFQDISFIKNSNCYV